MFACRRIVCTERDGVWLLVGRWSPHECQQTRWEGTFRIAFNTDPSYLDLPSSSTDPNTKNNRYISYPLLNPRPFLLTFAKSPYNVKGLGMACWNKSLRAWPLTTFYNGPLILSVYSLLYSQARHL